MNSLKYLSFGTLSCLFTLIFFGGYVSASGVGLSCPDWPLCPAGLVPMSEFLIEYVHRTLAATTGLLVIITMIFTLKSKSSRRGMKLARRNRSWISAGPDCLGWSSDRRKTSCSIGYNTLRHRHDLVLYVNFGDGLRIPIAFSDSQKRNH